MDNPICWVQVCYRLSSPKTRTDREEACRANGTGGIIEQSMSKLKAWLHEQKDLSVAYILRKLLQKKLEAYGTIQSFELDSQSSKLSAEVLLKGETDPITLHIEEYELREEPGGTFVTVRRASASRAWISLLVKEFLTGKSFLVPPEYARLVRAVL